MGKFQKQFDIHGDESHAAFSEFVFPFDNPRNGTCFIHIIA